VGSGGTMALVPAGVFANAPRFHSGAVLNADEVPAILQRGERVLSRTETRNYQAGQSGGTTNVNVTIKTQDLKSFKASRTQVAASLARAVNAGSRGL
jgi:hypothetical protein